MAGQQLTDRDISERQLKATLRLVELIKLGQDEQESRRQPDPLLAAIEKQCAESARWTQRIFWLLLCILIVIPVVAAIFKLAK